MNTELNFESKSPSPLNHAECIGLTHPNYSEFLKSLVRLIAKATRKRIKAVWTATQPAFLWLNRKLQDGAEIHSRQSRMTEDRYAKNFYHFQFRY